MATTLHGTWSPHACRFYIWGEHEPAARKGRASRAARRPHPFATPVDRLLGVVGRNAPAASVFLRLPTSDGRPLPAPAPLSPAAGSGTAEALELAEWQVPALELGAVAALEWLGAEPDTVAPSGDPVEGSDLQYWRAAARFALGLLRRERWFPMLAPEAEGRFGAWWSPALNLPEDAARFRTLAEAMPPACRALAGEGVAPGRQQILRSFLAVAVDAAVRAWAGPSPASGSAAAAWLAALRSPDGRVAERAENVRPLAAALRTWLQPIQASGEAGFRTCFRLDPPSEEMAAESPWWLSFWLQAIDEPSLLVPASEVWERGQHAMAALGRRWESPQERMLPALARAARLFSPVEAALKRRHPNGCALSTPEAYQFLREVAPLLEETGNGVLVPDWWRRPSARLGVRLRLRSAAPSTSSGLLSRERLVRFDWQMALGDEPLSPEEFEQLASLKTPLVRVRGKWLEVHPEEVERAIRAWERRRQDGPMGLLDALRLPEAEDTLPVTGVDVEGELRHLLGRLQGDERPDPVPVPETFRGALRHYQQFGLEWLAFLRQWDLGACLADDMGLGKTIEMLAYLLHVRRNNGDQFPPALIICPTSLVENWRREAARFAPSLQVYVHHGAGRVRGASDERPTTNDQRPPANDHQPSTIDHQPSTIDEGLNARTPEHLHTPTPNTQRPTPDDSAPPPSFADAVSGSDLVITTYPLALRDEETLRTVAWDTIILDEAQNIKNPAARQTRAIRTLSARARIAMTGTPVENRLTDLWSLMEFLNPGFLGSERGFRSKYARRIERDHDPEASERLRRLTRPFLLRRVKTDPSVIRDLPEKQEMKVVCTLTGEQATLYEAVVREMLEQVEEAEGMQRRGMVLAALSRLKQVCNHPAHYLQDGSALPGRSGKLERLVEMLEEVFSVGEAALVFTQFAEMGELLCGHLQAALGREALFLHGGVPRKQRDVMVERFQLPEGPPVMVLSLKAGGVGLNLTRASHVFHFDRWWNPAVENQATDRAFRIGQMRNVQVHKFLCAGSLEDHIDALIEQKRDLAQAIVGAGENWLTELSTAQLRDLVTLRREAVAEGG